MQRSKKNLKSSASAKLTQKQIKDLRKDLINRLDKLTSLIVRYRDTHCASCGKRIEFGKRQNGHFLGRAIIPTRWDLVNCNVECGYCNIYSSDHLVGYADYILQHYGKKEFDRLVGIKKAYSSGKIKNSMPIEDALKIYAEQLAMVRQLEIDHKKQLVPKSWDSTEKYIPIKTV